MQPFPLFAFFLMMLPWYHAFADGPGGDACHPFPTDGKAHYVVGYGSLMESASRKRTAPDVGEALPARVKGFRRAWVARGPSLGFGTTFLGAVADQGAAMNAAVFAVPGRADLEAMDRREQGYCRVKVDRKRIEVLGGAEFGDGEIWLYEIQPENRAAPDEHYPIVQSYVDIFLSGCLELERKYRLEAFARECVGTTAGWPEHWVNDRIFPRRPFAHQPNAGVIDRLLSEEVPDAFKSIRIE